MRQRLLAGLCALFLCAPLAAEWHDRLRYRTASGRWVKASLHVAEGEALLYQRGRTQAPVLTLPAGSQVADSFRFRRGARAATISIVTGLASSLAMNALLDWRRARVRPEEPQGRWWRAGNILPTVATSVPLNLALDLWLLPSSVSRVVVTAPEGVVHLRVTGRWRTKRAHDRLVRSLQDALAVPPASDTR